jgi:hypothetical protein
MKPILNTASIPHWLHVFSDALRAGFMQESYQGGSLQEESYK